MSKNLELLVFLPIVCAPFSYWIGRLWKRARDTFVQSVAILELLLVIAVMAEETTSVRWEGFCGLGIGFVSGGFHSVLAFLTASGWLAATVLSQEYFAHVKRRNRYYLFWLMTLGATMGVFLSSDLYITY